MMINNCNNHNHKITSYPPIFYVMKILDIFGLDVVGFVGDPQTGDSSLSLSLSPPQVVDSRLWTAAMTTSNSALALNSINIVRTSAILFINIINICTRIIDNIFSLKAKCSKNSRKGFQIIATWERKYSLHFVNIRPGIVPFSFPCPPIYFKTFQSVLHHIKCDPGQQFEANQ